MTYAVHSPRFWAAFQFFLRASGSRVAGSAQLARAEIEASARGFSVDWAPEWDCFCSEADVDCDCLRADRRGRTECHCESAVLSEWESWPDGSPRVLASLGGICSADADYRRIVSAELALEALSPEWERQARELSEWEAFLRIVSAPYVSGPALPFGGR